MTIVMAIDPGPVQSAFVQLNTPAATVGGGGFGDLFT